MGPAVGRVGLLDDVEPEPLVERRAARRAGLHNLHRTHDATELTLAFDRLLRAASADLT